MIKWKEINWRKIAISGGIGVLGYMSYIVKKYCFDNELDNDGDVDSQLDWLGYNNDHDKDDKIINVDYYLLLKEKCNELRINFDMLSMIKHRTFIIIIPASNTEKSVLEGNGLNVNDRNCLIKNYRSNSEYIIHIPKNRLLIGRNEIIINLTLRKDFIFPLLYYPHDSVCFSFIKLEPKAIRPSFIPHNNNTIESKIIVPSIKYLWLSFDSSYIYSHHYDNNKINLHSNHLISTPPNKGNLILAVFSFVKKLLTITYPYESFDIIFSSSHDNKEVMSYGYGFAKILSDLLENEQLNFQDGIYLNFLIANSVISSLLLNHLSLNNTKEIMTFKGICLLLTHMFFVENETDYPNEGLFIEELKTKVIDFSESNDSISINDALILKESETNEIASFKIGLLMIYIYSIESKGSEMIEMIKNAIHNKTSVDYIFNEEYQYYCKCRKVPKIRIDLENNSNDNTEKVIVYNCNHEDDINSQHGFHLQSSIQFYYDQRNENNIQQEIELSSKITHIPLNRAKPQMILFDECNNSLSLQEYTKNDIKFLLSAPSEDNKFNFSLKGSMIVINRNLYHMHKSGHLQTKDYITIIHNIIMNSLKKVDAYSASIIIPTMVYVVMEDKTIPHLLTLLNNLINHYFEMYPDLLDIIVNCIFDIIESNEHINIIMTGQDYLFYSNHNRHNGQSMWHFEIDYPSKDKEELLSKLKADYELLTSKLSIYFTNDHLSSKMVKQNQITNLIIQGGKIKQLTSLIFASPAMPFLANQSIIYYLIKDMNNTIKRIDHNYKKETLCLQGNASNSSNNK